VALGPLAVIAQESAPSTRGFHLRNSGSSQLFQQPPGWYASTEARAIADNVLQYQSPQGGWPKSTDVAARAQSPESIPQPGGGRANTIDNGATTTPMRFLALVAQATGESAYQKSFLRGVDYLLAAQYPNGGWPQYFPLRDGYYSRITYNDNAMINVLNLLHEVGSGRPPYNFVDENRRTRAAEAVERGVNCILRTQIKQAGKLTGWCAQHDEKTFEPAWGRSYEPPSLSGEESAGIVRFLMKIEQPTPEIIAAVEGAVAWLKAVAIHGVRAKRFMAADGERDGHVLADRDAGPLWARFYDIDTNIPIFLGRDGNVRYALSEIERERRGGYDYYGTWAASLIERDYPAWRTKHKLP
jgi:PelA/Pel-15E family pectate lyase